MINRCFNCNERMEATEVTTWRGESMPVWKCNNPTCSTQHYYHRFDTVKPPEEDKSWRRVSLGVRNNLVAECWYCPGCANRLEILDTVYKIWNCPNCLLVRSGGFGVKFFKLVDDKPDYGQEIREERRQPSAYYDPTYKGDEEEEEVWE